MIRSLLLFPAALLLIAADARDDASRQHLQKLQGTWVMESGESDGSKIPDDKAKANKITWKDDNVVVVSPHQSDKPIKAATTLDPSKSPAAMDFVRSEGPNAGKKIMGIYEFLGDDGYRVCFDPSGKERPKDFTTKKGSGHLLHVWKKAKE